ncbi:MAG TPA: hypothetical protein ENG83_02235 [Nitrospirae bacterium]|nr:hypothetical protein BMS3Abin06_02075 [bacterium BMS3Abin06]HDH11019.1 hypothetical protein [Nitrospirota bacterium]
MEDRGISIKICSFNSLIKGLLISTVLSFLFHSGISFVYNYLLESILLLISLTILCFLIFRINIKCDEISDRIDVFSKTIAFDFQYSQPKFFNLLRFFRPLNPYIGALGTILALLFVFLAVPALIIYLAIHPNPPGTSLKIGAFFLSTGIGILYYFFNKDKFPSLADKVMFFTGILLGPVGVFEIIS